VKINFVAKKILLSKHKTFHYTYLVVNLVQMLVCFTLIAILRISKVSLFPGQDYSLVCFYFFIVKTLQLRQESLLQDSFGLLPLALLSSSLFLNTSGSIFQASSIFLNGVLFVLPFPAFITAFIVVVQVTLQVFSLVSLYSVLSCAITLFVLISLKVSKSYCVIIILLCALRFTTFPSDSYVNDRHIIKYSSSLKISNESIPLVNTFHASTGYVKSGQSGRVLKNFSGDDTRYEFTQKLWNLEIKEEGTTTSDACNDGTITHGIQTDLLKPWVNDTKTGGETYKTGFKQQNSEPDYQFVGNEKEIMTVVVTSQNSESSSGGDDEEHIDLLNYNENKNHDNGDVTISEHKDEDGYYVLSSELNSSGHCSIEVTDKSNWNFFLSNFIQLNQLFRKILPRFPSHKPFQLKKISLLGFSHLCLSLPGSEVSLINLGEEEDRSGNACGEKGESCHCNENLICSLTYKFSSLLTECRNFVMSYFYMAN